MKKIKLAYLGMPLAIIAPVATVVSCGEAKIDKSDLVSVINSNNEWIVRINPNAYEADGKTQHGKFKNLANFSQQVSAALNAANIPDITSKNITISASGAFFDWNSIKAISGKNISDFLDATNLEALLNDIYTKQLTLGNWSNTISNLPKSNDAEAAANAWKTELVKAGGSASTPDSLIQAIGLEKGQTDMELANDELGFIRDFANKIYSAQLTKPHGWDGAKGDHKKEVLSDTLKGIVSDNLNGTDDREKLLANALLGMESLVDIIWFGSLDLSDKNPHDFNELQTFLINEFKTWKYKYTISKIEENLKAAKTVRATLGTVIDKFSFA